MFCFLDYALFFRLGVLAHNCLILKISYLSPRRIFAISSPFHFIWEKDNLHVIKAFILYLLKQGVQQSCAHMLPGKRHSIN